MILTYSGVFVLFFTTFFACLICFALFFTALWPGMQARPSFEATWGGAATSDPGEQGLAHIHHFPPKVHGYLIP